MRDLDKFDVLMFDLNGTFMFGQDRFGPDQDYYASYRQLGGSVLSAELLGAAIDQVLSVMGELYEAPEHRDRFPQISEVFTRLPITASLSEQEQKLLKDVIAVHEIGVISQSDKEAI